MKYYKVSYEYILWGISMCNLNMILATIPVMDTEKEKEEKVEMVDGAFELMMLEKNKFKK